MLAFEQVVDERFDGCREIRARRVEAAAEPLLGESLEGRRRVLGEEHPDTLSSIHNLAVLFKDQARYAEAEPLLREALEGRRRVLREEHPNTQASKEALDAVLAEREAARSASAGESEERGADGD